MAQDCHSSNSSDQTCILSGGGWDKPGQKTELSIVLYLITRPGLFLPARDILGSNWKRSRTWWLFSPLPYCRNRLDEAHIRRGWSIGSLQRTGGERGGLLSPFIISKLKMFQPFFSSSSSHQAKRMLVWEIDFKNWVQLNLINFQTGLWQDWTGSVESLHLSNELLGAGPGQLLIVELCGRPLISVNTLPGIIQQLSATLCRQYFVPDRQR